jgi:Raf kinase inhibitor-like YbhB/YbcL family protein
MLRRMPNAMGGALWPNRPGPARIALSELNADPRRGSIDVQSAAFRDGEAIPARFTADGQGVSPSIEWRGVPSGAVAVVVLIEDMDATAEHARVRAIVWGLPGRDGRLPEGALSSRHAHEPARTAGGGAFSTTRYLPPQPPRGNEPHRYAIQVLALDVAPDFQKAPGRGDVVSAARGHVVGAGCLIGTCARARARPKAAAT